MMLRSLFNISALIAAALLTFSAEPGLAQGQPPKPLFATSTPLSLRIEAPLSSLFRNRESNKAIQGVMDDGVGNRMAVQLNLRGITRRSDDVCAFPPLAIRFAAPPPPSSPFAGQKKLKLVTHCRNQSSSDRYVLLEYAAYRLYADLTPRSFGTRLATISYSEPGGKQLATRPGFFIEDIEDVAARNGLAEAHGGTRVPLASISPVDGARFGLFEHMISNHDWSMRAGPPGDDCCHNGKLIGGLSAGQAIPVPYDFDFSGLVDAPYAHPPQQLDIDGVTTRLYRGYCAHNPQVYAAAQEFRQKQPALLAELSAIPGLDRGAAGKAASFLQGFFNDIATDASLQSKVLKYCVR